MSNRSTNITELLWIDVARAIDVAFKYRNHFRKVCATTSCFFASELRQLQDIIIDLIVYRRWCAYQLSTICTPCLQHSS
jgi:hypothetical protein